MNPLSKELWPYTTRLLVSQIKFMRTRPVICLRSIQSKWTAIANLPTILTIQTRFRHIYVAPKIFSGTLIPGRMFQKRYCSTARVSPTSTRTCNMGLVRNQELIPIEQIFTSKYIRTKTKSKTLGYSSAEVLPNYSISLTTTSRAIIRTIVCQGVRASLALSRLKNS